MPYTVAVSFNEFSKNIVDLDSGVTGIARASRGFLISQLESLPEKIAGFPPLTGRFQNYGSFERKTKIRELDDIDLLVILDGNDTVPRPQPDYVYYLRLSSEEAPLYRFKDDGFDFVNSTKILNRIRDSLKEVTHYEKAGIKRTEQAVTLKLSSYPWAYDIVPAVEIPDGNSGADGCYLIPDGKGNWIRTDPRRDAKALEPLRKEHSGYFLKVMRLLKFWNRLRTKLPSYYFETIVCKVLSQAARFTDEPIPNAIKHFFAAAPTGILQACPDPKGLGPDLDEKIDSTKKNSVVKELLEADKNAGQAIAHKIKGDHEKAIYCWRQVFGNSFPAHGT